MPALKELEDLLRAHPFVAGLDDAYVKKLVAIAGLRSARENEYLFRTGAPADCCYLMREGLVGLEIYHPSRGHVLLQTVGPGKVVGWSWLVEPYKWTFDGRALETTHGICLDAVALRQLCDADPVLGYQLLKRFTPIMSDRIEAARVQLLDLYGVES